MQWLTTSRFAALGLMGAAYFTACAENPAPQTNENAIDLAYAALVADIANCAKQVKSCTDAADDDATLATCRSDFASCRESAGKHSVNGLASAVRSCTSTHNACVRSAEHGEAGSCQDELRSCLRAAHPNQADDEDAGGDSDRGKGKRADCMDELHPCVKADGPANVCAEQVRMCLVDSMPAAEEVIPESDSDDMDSDAASDETADTGSGSGKPSDDAGTSHGKSEQAKQHKPDATDAGVRGNGKNKGNSDKGQASEARACVDALRACIEAGNPARGCAKSLKECRTAATP